MTLYQIVTFVAQITQAQATIGDWLWEHFTSLAVVGCGAFIRVWITNIKKRLDAHEVKKARELKLIRIEVESIAYAMGKVNSGIGAEFSEAFEKRKEQLMKDTDFIYKKTE